MSDFEIYKNLKQWLFLYGSELLDCILPITNERTDDPLCRYTDLPFVFDKHFNLMAYYNVQTVPDLPLILISFFYTTKLSCFRKLRVRFDVYFETVSPNDCSDDRIIIFNSPESILRYQQQVNNALCDMMNRNSHDLRGLIIDDKKWAYPINYKVFHFETSQMTNLGTSEILHFQSDFDIEDEISCCE